jgi:hypothetical protein
MRVLDWINVAQDTDHWCNIMTTIISYRAGMYWVTERLVTFQEDSVPWVTCFKSDEVAVLTFSLSWGR